MGTVDDDLAPPLPKGFSPVKQADVPPTLPKGFVPITPKKVGGNGGGNTSLPLPNGGTIDQSFQPTTEPTTPYSPQYHQQQAKKQQALSNQLQGNLNTYKAVQGENIAEPEQVPDQVKAYAPPTLGQKAAFELKSIAGSLNKGVANMVIAPLYQYGNKIGLVSDDEKARVLNEVANSTKETFGLNPQTLQEGDSSIHNAINQFAFMAPALITASGTGGASFGLQTAGQAATQIQQMKNNGVEFNNHSDDLFILGSGIIGTALGRGSMGKLFGSFGSATKNNIVSALTADAIKELGEKGVQASADDIAKTFLSKAQTLSDKVGQVGLSALQNYAKAGTELSAANAATFGTKALANAVSGNEPFKDTTGQDFIKGVEQPFGLGKDAEGNPLKAVWNMATSTAGVFGGLGGASEALGMLGHNSNPTIEKLQEDNSPESVASLKQDIVEHGKGQGWSDAEIQNAQQGVDLLSQTVAKLPKNIKPEKVSKGVSIILGRNELEDQLGQLQDERSKLDPSVANISGPQEELIQHKIDQANDKLKDLVTGDRTTYSKGTGEDEGTYYKTTGGVKEEIAKSRYDLEVRERDAKSGNVEKPVETTEEPINKEGEQDAAKIESPGTLDVGESPGNGEAMGEGHPEQGEPTGESQPEIGSSENAQPEEEVVPKEQPQAEPTNEQTPIPETPETPTEETAKPDAEVTEQPDQPKTGIRNEDVAKERGENIPRTEKPQEQTDEEGKRLVESGELDPDEFAKKIIEKPYPASTEEQAALRYHKVNLEKEQRKLAKDPTPENEAQYALNEDRLENNRKATEIIGNELGRGLGDRAGQMAEDYSRIHVLERAKMANGSELSKADQAELETRTKRIEELKNQLFDREEQIKKLHEDALVNKVNRSANFEERQAKREVTKSSLRKEREGLLADLHLIAKKSMGTLGANKIPVDMITPLAKLARNYVLDGATTLSGVVDKIYTDLKDHIDGLKKEDIAEVIKDNFDKYLSEQNEKRLSAAKKRQQTKLESLKEQHETGNFDKQVRNKIQVDNDYLKIRAEINRQQTLINKKIADIANSKKSIGRKAVDFAVKWGRQMKLASITVLGKLAATGLTTMGLKAGTEIVGAGLSKVLPRIAKKATVESGINVKELAKSYAKAATEGMKDAYDELNLKKGGQSDLSALYGKYVGTKLPAEAADFFGHLHSAIKAPIKRQAWEYSYAKRVAKTIDAGLDPQDPVIDAKNRLDAYKDGERAIFMGDNLISKAYESSMKTLENSSSGSAQNIAALTRILLPFVKVPTNIALSSARYALGLVPGLGKLGQVGAADLAKRVGAESLAKIIHSGMGEVSPEEADMILRNLKHGSVGGAALLVGFFNPQNVGGYYQPGEKRKSTDVNAGSLKIGNTKIPVWMTEHPIFQAMQMGATFRRVLDAHRKKEDDIGAATLATASGLAEAIPLAKEAKQITDLFGNDTHKVNQFISGAVKGEVEPAFLQQIAQVTDTKNHEAYSFSDKNQQKRAPDKKHGLLKYMKQDLETGIPELRKNVPIKK